MNVTAAWEEVNHKDQTLLAEQRGCSRWWPGKSELVQIFPFNLSSAASQGYKMQFVR